MRYKIEQTDPKCWIVMKKRFWSWEYIKPIVGYTNLSEALEFLSTVVKSKNINLQIIWYD